MLVPCNPYSFASNPSHPPLIRGGAYNLPPDKGGLRGVAFRCYKVLVAVEYLLLSGIFTHIAILYKL
jgi:hypothetical protein